MWTNDMGDDSIDTVISHIDMDILSPCRPTLAVCVPGAWFLFATTTHPFVAGMAKVERAGILALQTNRALALFVAAQVEIESRV
jgi:hypothetical protein